MKNKPTYVIRFDKGCYYVKGHQKHWTTSNKFFAEVYDFPTAHWLCNLLRDRGVNAEMERIHIPEMV